MRISTLSSSWSSNPANTRLVSTPKVNPIPGYRNTIRSLRSGQSKLILIASNCPAIRRTELEYYAVLAKSDVHHFDGNNVEMGTACAKLFPVSAMVISDPGDSDILESV